MEVVCGIVHFLSTAIAAIWLNGQIKQTEKSPHDLAMMFNIVTTAASILLTTNTSFILWKRKTQLLEFVNHTANCRERYVKYRVKVDASI
ncbi:unnamed protein product [Orchesella dallaii]|uniref:Transmembrane protein n=1 Tax=Orchesella dallaii TaxID=48710 RepID=A0ABP1QCT4_9HEXA